VSGPRRDAFQERETWTSFLFGLVRGDRKWSLKDGQIPNSRGVRVALGTEYHRVEGNRRASRERSPKITRNPQRYDSQLFLRCVTVVSSRVARARAVQHTQRGDGGKGADSGGREGRRILNISTGFNWVSIISGASTAGGNPPLGYPAGRVVTSASPGRPPREGKAGHIIGFNRVSIGFQ
jgi:hypothetical protein